MDKTFKPRSIQCPRIRRQTLDATSPQGIPHREIEKSWDFEEQQMSEVDGRRYDVHKAIEASQVLQVKDLWVDTICLTGLGVDIDGDFIDFVSHMRMVNDADTSYPLILNQFGSIIDGRHRLAKALLYKELTLPYVTFIVDPPEIYEEADDEDL